MSVTRDSHQLPLENCLVKLQQNARDATELRGTKALLALYTVG